MSKHEAIFQIQKGLFGKSAQMARLSETTCPTFAWLSVVFTFKLGRMQSWRCSESAQLDSKETFRSFFTCRVGHIFFLCGKWTESSNITILAGSFLPLLFDLHCIKRLHYMGLFCISPTHIWEGEGILHNPLISKKGVCRSCSEPGINTMKELSSLRKQPVIFTSRKVQESAI